MTPMEKLAWLQANVCAFSIDVNDHRSYYEPLKDSLEDQRGHGFVDDAMSAECLAHGQIVEVQVYPFTPVGFLKFVHWDLEQAICEAYETVREEIEKSRRTR